MGASRLAKIGHFSPLAISARAMPTSAVTTTSRLEYDMSTGTPISVGIQGSISATRGLDLSADVSRSFRQRLTNGTPIYDSVVRLGGRLVVRSMKGSYSITRDLTRGYNVQQSVGWSYNAQCCGVALDYQAFNYPEISSLFPVSADQRIQFTFMLAGLGTFQNFFGTGGTR